MIDWLRRNPFAKAAPEAATPRKIVPRTVTVGGQEMPLVIRKLRHARRMTLRLAPDGSEARLSIPHWGRIADGEAFVRDRTDWLAQQLERMPGRTSVAPGGSLPYRGATLAIDWQERAGRRPQVTGDGAILVGGPAEGLESRLRRWLEKEALRLMGADLAHYCARAGQDVPRLTLSRAQRRWGSCAGDGSIRMNWRLVMAPDGVRRSVVAHEVAHLVHFDHSTAFHAELARIYEGDVAAANGWLKAEGRTLYRLFG
jgi:predicted metal-dependent hydrolase